MSKVHYPCGGWADNTGAHAACVRKDFKNTPAFDGRASYITCKRCLFKAIPKGSQWVNVVSGNVVRIRQLFKDLLKNRYVEFENNSTAVGMLPLHEFVIQYEPRL